MMGKHEKADLCQGVSLFPLSHGTGKGLETVELEVSSIQFFDKRNEDPDIVSLTVVVRLQVLGRAEQLC